MVRFKFFALKKMSILLILTLLTTACPYSPDYELVDLWIVNKSTDRIIYTIEFEYFDGSSGLISELEYNPWTCNMYGEVVSKLEDSKSIVNSNDSLTFSLKSESEKYRFSKGGWISYYLFSLDSVATIPWSRIRDEKIWLKEVTFRSWEEMEACNFTITYP